MTYRHLNTGATAELIEVKENTAKLKVIETDELKEIGASTFKRWWKPVEAETPVEATPEMPEDQDAPTEDQDSLEQTEAPEPEGKCSPKPRTHLRTSRATTSLLCYPKL